MPGWGKTEITREQEVTRHSGTRPPDGAPKQIRTTTLHKHKSAPHINKQDEAPSKAATKKPRNKQLRAQIMDWPLVPPATPDTQQNTKNRHPLESTKRGRQNNKRHRGATHTIKKSARAPSRN